VIMADRESLLRVLGAVMVRNLNPDVISSSKHEIKRSWDADCDGAVGPKLSRAVSGAGCHGDELLNTYCEIFEQDRIVYRTGILKSTVNPSWTLRSRENDSCFLFKQEFDDQLKPFVPLSEIVFTLKIYAVNMSCRNRTNMLLDTFPYHQENKPSPDPGELILEKSFRLDDLESTGLLSNEMSQLGSVGANAVYVGLHYEAAELVVGTDGEESREIKVKRGTKNNVKVSASSGNNLYVYKVIDHTTLVETDIVEEEEANQVTGKGTVWTKENAVSLIGESDYEKLLEVAQRLTEATMDADTAQEQAAAVLVESTSHSEQKWKRLVKEREVAKHHEEELLLREKCKSLSEQVTERLQQIELWVENLKLRIETLSAANEFSDMYKADREKLEKAEASHVKEQCLVRTHRINLLRSLENIYPLQERYTEAGQWMYTIRGLPLPDTLLSNPAAIWSYEEERISTAFGYLAHFVNLMGKYVDISLRFIPLPHSSSSTICDPLIICAETPHEPLARYQTTHQGSSPSFPQYIFGSASGRLGRANARRALSLGTYPLYWKGLSKSSRPRFEYAVKLLGRDIHLFYFVHRLKQDGPRSKSSVAGKADPNTHMIALLQKILADF